jgi:hypothetical protein
MRVRVIRGCPSIRLGEQGSSSRTLWSVEYNQSQTTSISQNEMGTTSASESGNSVTGGKSGTSYDTSTVSLYPAETNLGNQVGPPQLSVTATGNRSRPGVAGP